MARWRSLTENPALICQLLCALTLAVVPACGDDSDDDGTGGSGGSGRGGSAGRAGSAGSGGGGGLAGGGGGKAGTGGSTAGSGGNAGNAGNAGSGGGTAGTGAGGSAGGGGSPGDVNAGRTVAQNNCQSCHTADFGGSTTVPGGGVFARNLTPHATGLLDWSDQEITRAIREGRDADGNELCPAMPRFGNSQINATQLRNLIAFLRSLAPVDRAIPDSTCGS